MEIGLNANELGLGDDEQTSYEEMFKREEEQKQRNVKNFRPIIYEMVLPKEVAATQQKLENLGESKFHKEARAHGGT